ncbi:Elongation factor Ts, mitochondrial [Taphrina deformans PYCC 5710]|uniref:Elongation factor Ts, mitochondrial n=1 Tax=Taphrina deformans (strain PYCC 5710 / ATCC 11124 / CBS 356.35 / IMI 108563 / JCM 9778 / NBRC 8474) TaxID=1097556 RepID=R4XCF0_TAPDE|nr:Elongation factor Ts, mitochondrial [Taphrina deformans PYCC 5710]|eukprot:CCG82046.1 Elongation factor Ts, mitochondrial [Taphrina deformans PYCC 5710]
MLVSSFCRRSCLTTRLYSTGAKPLTTIQLIKKLREELQAPLNLVKSAVSAAEPSGNYESALAILKKEMIKRGEKLVAKSADRAATEGWVIAARSGDGTAGSLSVLNCETDFVAKSSKVVELASKVGQRLAVSAKSDDTPKDRHRDMPQEEIDNVTLEGVSLKEALTQSMSVYGESMRMTRASTSSIKHAKMTAIGIHCHGGPTLTQDVYLGRMGAMINIVTANQTTKEMADELAREVVAQNPDSMEEFWALEKVGDPQQRTVRQWAGDDVEIVSWTRLER